MTTTRSIWSLPQSPCRFGAWPSSLMLVLLWGCAPGATTVAGGSGGIKGVTGGSAASTDGGNGSGGMVSTGGTTVPISTGGASSASGGASETGGATGAGAATPTGGAAGGVTAASGGASETGGASPGGRGGGSGGNTGSAGNGGAAGSTGGSAGSSARILETISVPASGNGVSSTAKLDAGELFLLKAAGTVDTGSNMLDAEYGGFASGGAGQDIVGGVDVGVDTGFKVERVTAITPAGRKKWFGPYRADHTYYSIVTGTGAPLTLKLLRPAGTTGTGEIGVAIIRLSPVPQMLPGLLDTLSAPVTNQTIHSTLMTRLSSVYLLQVAGSGKVGGAALALGDADWMDWDVNGVGKLDIGDNNVDYGLGVDESNTAQTPRLRWWGPWRKDHTYFMLFAGTGNTIAFTYYDSGYGDNSTTDKLAVHIYAAP